MYFAELHISLCLQKVEKRKLPKNISNLVKKKLYPGMIKAISINICNDTNSHFTHKLKKDYRIICNATSLIDRL